MGRFLNDTAVELVRPGSYRARIDAGWWIQRGPNGGYIAAIMLRAMSTEVGEDARPVRSLTVHYLRPPAEGPVEVEVTTERTGRSVTNVSARLVQDGSLMAIALAAFGTERDGPSFGDARPPAVPPPDQLEPEPSSSFPIAIRDRFDTRHALGARVGERSTGPAVTGGWIRLSDPDVVDQHVLTAMADAWYPAVFGRLALPVGVPTIDLTVHLRKPPPPGTEWVLVRFTTRSLAGGYLEEDGELWHPDGTLLAQSRQLAVLLPG
jgi:acyl-CoA thioesterase